MVFTNRPPWALCPLWFSWLCTRRLASCAIGRFWVPRKIGGGESRVGLGRPSAHFSMDIGAAQRPPSTFILQHIHVYCQQPKSVVKYEDWEVGYRKPARNTKCSGPVFLLLHVQMLSQKRHFSSDEFAVYQFRVFSYHVLCLSPRSFNHLNILNCLHAKVTES